MGIVVSGTFYFHLQSKIMWENGVMLHTFFGVEECLRCSVVKFGRWVPVFHTHLLRPSSGNFTLKMEVIGTSMFVPMYQISITVWMTVVCMNLSSSQLYKMDIFMSIKYFSAETCMYLVNCLLFYLHHITLSSNSVFACCIVITSFQTTSPYELGSDMTSHSTKFCKFWWLWMLQTLSWQTLKLAP